ncbi:hypothetical protein ACFLYQ_00610 [Chloroflexota bacterium]
MADISVDIEGMAKRIASIRKNADELKAMSGGIQAVDKNADRILASVKMLEINISDVVDIVKDSK